MITNLEITGFRGHERRTLGGLARVNLLVGPNNAGKTGVLDAIEILLRDGHPQVLTEQATKRGGASGGQQLPPTIRHLFYGHATGAAASFTIASAGDPTRVIKVDFADKVEETQVPNTGLITIKRDDLDAAQVGVGNLSAGSNGFQPKARAGKVARVEPGPADDATLHRLWADIVGNPGEDLVVEALRLVDPLLERVVFAPEGGGGKGPIYVRRRTETERIPLTTMGEGVRRTLALAISLVSARGGTLLVDEIDDGLHFRVMTGLWGFLIREARRLDVQVFATTHSSDCLEAIGWIHRRTPELVTDVAVLRVQPDATEAVRFTPEEIDQAVEFKMDVRG